LQLHVPDELQRGAPHVRAAGPENTGEKVLRVVTERIGVANLAETDVLDVGCGVRFAQTIVNRGIAVKSYTGIEVDERIVDFLNEHVAAHDSRFRFFRWNVRNAMYNPGGVALAGARDFPPLERFDLIILYSVFTHLDPDDAAVMLQLLRSRARPSAKLFFTAFVDEGIATFEDRDAASPLRLATYGRAFMDALIARAGWRVDGFFAGEPGRYVQPHFVCSCA
jgi:SAM-dependent methyltransferase